MATIELPDTTVAVLQRIRAGWLPHKLSDGSWWWGRPSADDGFKLWHQGVGADHEHRRADERRRQGRVDRQPASVCARAPRTVQLPTRSTLPGGRTVRAEHD